MTYILYNPLANGGNGLEGLNAVKGAFDAPEMMDVTKIDERAVLTGMTAQDKVILCGGDGTINRLINEIEGADISVPIYIWKFGTGNDFSRDVPEKTEKEMVLLNEHLQNLPYAQIGGRHIRFVNNCCYGVDGLVCELGEANKANGGGGQSYTKLALRAIFRDYKRTKARVTVDGETREYDKVWMASTMNGRYVGGGMKLAPGQDRRSDKLCCIVFHGPGRLELLIRFFSVFSGKHVKWKNLCDVRFGHEIKVEFDQPTAAQLDGEVVSQVTEYTAYK